LHGVGTFHRMFMALLLARKNFVILSANPFYLAAGGQKKIIMSLINSASLKKNSDALQAYVIQCCGTSVPSGVVQKLPSTVTKDSGRLVGCSKCLDRKQQSSCDRWLWLYVAHSVCRRQPTSDADVQQAQPPVGKAQPDTGELVPADTC